MKIQHPRLEALRVSHCLHTPLLNGKNNSSTRIRILEKPMMSPEGIRITKGEVIEMTTFIKISRDEKPLLGGDDNIYWLCM